MFGLFGPSRFVRQLPQGLSAGARLAAREAVLDSPHMAANNLNARFAGTYGFSIAFSRAGLAEVRANYPAFAPFFDAVLDARCNAFFFNPLLIADGAGVQPHVDMSLQSYCPGCQPPKLVSVWYLQVPPGLRGGELKLYTGERLRVTLPPREGGLLHFRGDLRHEVAAVVAGAPDIYEARLSLVVEQYRLTDLETATMPRVLVGSRREGPVLPAPLSGGVGEGAFGDALHEALADPTDNR